MGTHTSRITRSGDLTVAATFNWAVSAGTGTNPVNAADFPGGVFPTGTATVPANATYVDVSFTSNPDTTVETDETGLFTVTSSQTGVTVAASPQAFTITNDDSAGGGGSPTIVYGPTVTMNTGVVDTTSKSHKVETVWSSTRLITLRVNHDGTNSYTEMRQASDTSVLFSTWIGGVRQGSELPFDGAIKPDEGAPVSLAQRLKAGTTDRYEQVGVYGTKTMVLADFADTLAKTQAQGVISFSGDNSGRSFTISKS